MDGTTDGQAQSNLPLQLFQSWAIKMKRNIFQIYFKIDEQKFVSNNKPTECQVLFELPNLLTSLVNNQNIAQSVR